MTNIQHADDIEIPDIEIAAGWAVSDLSTQDDCDDAFAYLMSAVASIEYQLEVAVIPGDAHYNNPGWRARTNAALKYKRAALQIAQNRRGRIVRAENQVLQRERDRVLLEFIRANVPSDQFLEWVRGAAAIKPLQEAA